MLLKIHCFGRCEKSVRMLYHYLDNTTDPVSLALCYLGLLGLLLRHATRSIRCKTSTLIRISS